MQDLETFDLEDFKYNFVNISAFRLVNSESNYTRNLLRDMEEFQPIGQSILNKTNIIQVGKADQARHVRCIDCKSTRRNRRSFTTVSWPWLTAWPPSIEALLSGSPTSRVTSSSRGMTDRRSSITSTLLALSNFSQDALYLRVNLAD